MMKLVILIVVVAGSIFWFLEEKGKSNRPEFSIQHKGVEPEKCNLVYKDGKLVVTPKDMKIHDYFKRSDGEYYFAVSSGSQRFLLKASDVLKVKCTKVNLSRALKFAKYCKSLNTSGNSINSKDEYNLSSKEESHIRRVIKRLEIRDRVLEQRGKNLSVYRMIKRQGRSKPYKKFITKLFIIEGFVRNGSTSVTLWSTASPDRSATYCTSEEMAYYYAVCDYFETVRNTFYKGPKPRPAE